MMSCLMIRQKTDLIKKWIKLEKGTVQEGVTYALRWVNYSNVLR